MKTGLVFLSGAAAFLRIVGRWKVKVISYLLRDLMITFRESILMLGPVG